MAKIKKRKKNARFNMMDASGTCDACKLPLTELIKYPFGRYQVCTNSKCIKCAIDWAKDKDETVIPELHNLPTLLTITSQPQTQ